jgi:hypothetical protein
MAARKRPRRGPAQCRNCRAPIAFFLSPFMTGQVRAFNPYPVDPRVQSGAASYPVLGRQAYRLPDLVDQLMVLRQCSHSEAEEEAADLPRHTFHACPDSTRGLAHPDDTGGDR